MRKLKPEDIQEGRVFHNSEESAKVLRTETRGPQSPPLRVVVFQDLGNRVEERRLPINIFCARYKRKKR